MAEHADDDFPSGHLIRKALLAGRILPDTVRAAVRDELFRRQLVAWLEMNEEAALAGKETIPSIEEIAVRVIAHYVGPNR